MKVEVSEDVLAALLEAARRNGDADSLDEAMRLLQVMGQVTCYARARRKKKLKSIFTPIPFSLYCSLSHSPDLRCRAAGSARAVLGTSSIRQRRPTVSSIRSYLRSRRESGDFSPLMC